MRGGEQTTIGVGYKRVVVCSANDYWIAVKRIVVRGVIHYSFALIPLFGLDAQPIRLLLRVGIKVADEWQISLDYVRGSNIYVRGYLDLRAWSLRLRT